MTKDEFVKHFNEIAQHNKQSRAIERALTQYLLEDGVILKYGGRLEDCCIELLSLLSGIKSGDIAELIYEGKVIIPEPNSIVKTCINHPEALYEYYNKDR